MAGVIERRGCGDLPVHYIFKLRSNIVLDGDLALARMELDPYFSTAVQDIRSVTALLQDFPQLRSLGSLTALDSYTRASGVQALLSTGPLALLPDLVRSVAFVQRIYCVTQASDRVHAWLAGLQSDVKAVMGFSSAQDSLLIHAIPHYALYEFSAVVARRTQRVEALRPNLDLMLAALKENSPSPAGIRLAREALSARATTAPLSHGIHYYKAKFFPRLARSLLHSCSRRLGDNSHRVLDPFVGSGTTSLEAATLGIPSVGLDIDPLSVLISRTKHAAVEMDPDLLDREHVRTRELFDELGSTGASAGGEGRPITFPAWLTKNRKMTPEISRELGDEIKTLRAAIVHCAPELSSLLQVLVSDAIARRIRMRFLGTGVGRFSLTFAKTPAPRIFDRSLAHFVRTASAMDWLRQLLHLELAPARVLQADARCLPDDLGDFDILLTSPPYLPASSGRESYAKARAPSLIALGIKESDEVDDLVDGSIGSMDGDGANLMDLTTEGQHLVEWLQRDSLRRIKAEPTARYLLEMRQAFVEMKRVLRPGGLAVVVSGKRSTFYNYSTREVHPCRPLGRTAGPGG